MTSFEGTLTNTSRGSSFARASHWLRYRCHHQRFFSMPRSAYHQRYPTDVSSFLHSHCHQLSHWHIFIAACFGTLSMLLDNSDLSSVHPQCCLISVHVHLHRCQPLLHNKRRLPSMHSHRTALPWAHYPATADITAQRCHGHTLTLTNVQFYWHSVPPIANYSPVWGIHSSLQ